MARTAQALRAADVQMTLAELLADDCDPKACLLDAVQTADAVSPTAASTDAPPMLHQAGVMATLVGSRGTPSDTRRMGRRSAVYALIAGVFGMLATDFGAGLGVRHLPRQ